MQAILAGRTIELVQGDITQLAVDAVVNAANSQLAGGGGVDGAIHRAGGAEIKRETDRRYPGGCPTGAAVISGAGELPAKYVIHAVGPVWHGGITGEEDLLVSAYRTSLELASKENCTSVAFPALSCGAYGYPLAEASRVAIDVVVEWVREQPSGNPPTEILFALFSDEVFGAFAEALRKASD